MGKDSSQEMRRTQAEKMLKQPKKLRAKWISRLFTLIMVAALSVATMGLLIKTTVLNADFTSKELAKDENIGKLYTEANQTLASSAQMYRIPASYADSLITKKQFRQDVEIAIKRIYDGQVTQIVDTNTLSSQIQTNVNKEIASSGLPVDASVLNNYISQQIPSTQLQQVYDAASNISGYVTLMITAGSIITVVMLILVLLLQRSLFGWLHYTGLAFLITGIIFCIIGYTSVPAEIFPSLINQSGILGSIVENYAHAILSQIVNMGIIESIIGIVALLVSFFRKV